MEDLKKQRERMIVLKQKQWGVELSANSDKYFHTARITVEPFGYGSYVGVVNDDKVTSSYKTKDEAKKAATKWAWDHLLRS